MSVCLCVCVSVCVQDNSINNGSIVLYGNSSDEFDIGHCTVKVKVTLKRVKSNISAWHMLASCDYVDVLIRY